MCGRCAGGHATRDYVLEGGPLKCCNCLRGECPSSKVAHAATDARGCPLLAKRIKEKIFNINYG